MCNKRRPIIFVKANTDNNVEQSMENSIEPVHDLSKGASGGMAIM